MLRIGIIGFGGSGQAHLSISRVGRLPGDKISIPNPRRRLGPRARVGRHFLRRQEPSGPTSTPSSSARLTRPTPVIVAALERGLHVLVEKPLTDSVEGLCAIRRAAAAAPSQVVAVVHQMRFVPLHQRIKALVADGRSARLVPRGLLRPRPDRARVPERSLARDDNATPLVYSGCHFVDLLRWLAGEEIVEVFAAANHVAFPDYPESDSMS